MAKARARAPPEGLLDRLSQSLPDERPITALAIVENTGRCPAGFFPILKTYDEDSDADLWRQPVIFGRRACRYVCISKARAATRLVGVRVVGAGDAAPAGFSCVAATADTGKPAWRRRQLCFRAADEEADRAAAPLTDIIVCSKLKKAPMGFQYAGDINGLTICYKTTSISVSNGLHYENVLYKAPAPEPSLRAPPERPPRVGALVAQLNQLNLENDKSPGDASNHDYEILTSSYSLTPTRPAPAAPVPPAPLRHTQSYTYNTLGAWTPLEGVPFVLNANLSATSASLMSQLPKIKKRTLPELDRQYPYDFLVERQT